MNLDRLNLHFMNEGGEGSDFLSCLKFKFWIVLKVVDDKRIRTVSE